MIVILLAACTSSDVPNAAGTDPVSPTVSVALPTETRAQVDPLTCVGTGVDADRWTYRWELDGVEWSALLLTTNQKDDTVFPGYTREGQIWTCTAEAWLGDAPVGSASATVEIAGSTREDLDPLLPAAAWVSDNTAHYQGALAASDALTLTYGVDGWAERNAARGATLFMRETPQPKAMFTVPLEYDGQEWTAAIEIPDGSHVVHMIVDDGVSIDDADGREYTRDLVFPSVGPYLTWNDVAQPQNGMVINWVTGQPGLGVVEYGIDQADTAFVTGSVVDTMHHVALTGLPEATTFTYRVWDAAGRASPWSTFRTAAEDEDTYTFLVASDMQDAGGWNDRWVTVAAEMEAAVPDARYLLIPGDLPADDDPALWWLFFDGGRELFSHVPLVPSIGNHDDPGIESNSDTTSWRYWFDLPAAYGGEVFWRMDYGRTRLFAIDSEEAGQTQPGGVQYEWMAGESIELEQGDDRAVDWAVAAFHIPCYDAGSRFALNARTFRPLTELFDGAMDVVITGHEHMYQRFQPLQYDGVIAPSGEYGLGADDGVLYMVTPSAGFGMLDGGIVDPDDPGGEQRALLAYPDLSESRDDDDDDDDDGDDDEVEAERLHGYLVGEATPTELTFTFMAMGDSNHPASGTVADTVTVRR